MRSKYTHLPECQRPCLRRCQDPVAQTEIGMSRVLLPRPRTIAALGHMQQHDDSTKNMTIVLDSIETNRRRRGKGSPIPGEREKERERENIEVYLTPALTSDGSPQPAQPPRLTSASVALI